MEPEMIAAAALEAERRAMRHILWMVGRVEDLEAPGGELDLVTAASAFHRFDQPRLAELVHYWLKPGAAFVTVGDMAATSGRAEWRRSVASVVRTYVGQPVQRLGGTPNPTPEEGLSDEQQVLRQAGFTPVESRMFETRCDWTVESLLGHLRSTSFASRAALGERHNAFEADVTAALLASGRSGRYQEIAATGYTLARKPPSQAVSATPHHPARRL